MRKEMWLNIMLYQEFRRYKTPSFNCLATSKERELKQLKVLIVYIITNDY